MSGKDSCGGTLDFRTVFTYNTAMKEEKNLTIISFTDTGSRLGAALCRQPVLTQTACRGYAPEKYAARYSLRPLPEDMKAWIGTLWGKDAFLFIGAAGIAVRLIAPWVHDKYTDSPVIVMDEKGQYIIPLLSGHVGGAVELARVLAGVTGGVPVITTATDVQETFAVDMFALKNGLKIGSRELAKQISAAVLDQKKIGLYSESPIDGSWPEELEPCTSLEELQRYPYGIAITEEGAAAGQGTEKTVLRLKHRACIVAGIGCRKGTQMGQLAAGLGEVLQAHRIEAGQITAFASIELKKGEPGLRALAEEYEVPFHTFTAQELSTVAAVSSHSEFVERVTGVDNVCERAALRLCPDGELIQPKICAQGATFALVRDRCRLCF
ncbi:cobalt-precorrin 5A hydrolase [Dorea sp. D27]|uniref:cobalt-precorrin 5A hydrolase n=1 Tax=Dorea sp. D27 TaxID=658665 RepID=UPI0006737602|nr:cobalamin biosynthesis protein [Dorea sp. D27]